MYSPNDMKTMKMYFLFTKMKRGKDKIQIFHVIFLNNDISHYFCRYHSKILNVSSSYPSRGKRVSDFLFRP